MTDRFQYPSTTLSKKHDTSNAYVQLFEGEARKLLYELKNLMKFRNLGQLKMTRLFTDGTVITAWSIFGQDFVNIDISRSVGVIALAGKAECTITFIEFPDAVPPMKNPLRVKSGEVQGVDYFKTYYTVEVKNCPNCQDISWEFTFTYTEPKESRHWINPYTKEEELDNHTVHSLWPPAWGELIEQGEDEKGKFIIWKAYTESGDESDYSRTGLGVMLLRAIIKDEKMVELCRQQQKIDVDCCLKAPDLRKVEIWWEDFGTCQPFIMYKGVLYDAICKMDTSIPMVGTRGLIWYACTHPYQPFYAIPEILGSCLPVEWKLTGPIAFLGSDKNDNSIFIKCLEGATECYATASITLTDRCGNQYVIQTKPCCAEAEPLSINYTSLQMSCSGQQQFYAMGGCGPYKWSCGAGTITEDGLYTAPDTNPNCANDTVTVTDCCGSSAECTIAINCGTGHAYKTCQEIICETGPPVLGYLIIDTYECDGSHFSRECAFYWGGMEWHTCDCDNCCDHYLPDGGCAFVVGGDLVDIRSSAQKEAGCCPLALA